MTETFLSRRWSRPFALLVMGTALVGAVQAQRPATQRNGDHIVAVVNTESVTSIEVEQRV